LASPNIDWVLERIEGPHWLVLSSQQVTAMTVAPQARVALAREDVALARGACVLRPTMIYGKGRDRNLTRLIRLMRRWRVPIVVGDGSQRIQPMNVDDLIELICCHKKALVGGLYPVAGAEALPMAELVTTLAQILGLRCPVLALPQGALRLASRLGPLMGVRPDQVRRLSEPKIADVMLAVGAFNWRPAPLGLRLEQAVIEAVRTDVGGPPALGATARGGPLADEAEEALRAEFPHENPLFT
jgi:uncharacterized protein YbjT (DUF2867 family)